MSQILSPHRVFSGGGNNGWRLNCSGLYFATSGDVLDVGTSDFSASAWIHTTASGAYCLLGKRAGGGVGTQPGWIFRFSAGRFGIYLDQGGGTWIEKLCDAGDAVNDGKWHHVAVAVDRSGNVLIYKDASPCKTMDVSSVAGNLDNSAVIGIAQAIAFIGSVYDGKILDVKLAIGTIWNSGNISYQYNNPFNYGASAGALSDYWRCDEGSGTTISGNVNDMTLSNAAAWKYGDMPRR